MKLTPARGYLFVVPVGTIPPSSKEVGFGGKTETFKLEEPYQLRVIAVGGARQGEGGVMVYSEVKVGDIISSVNTNATLRERIDKSGFLMNGEQVLVIDILDVMGIWKEDAKTITNSGTINSLN